MLTHLLADLPPFEISICDYGSSWALWGPAKLVVARGVASILSDYFGDLITRSKWWASLPNRCARKRTRRR